MEYILIRRDRLLFFFKVKIVYRILDEKLIRVSYFEGSYETGDWCECVNPFLFDYIDTFLKVENPESAKNRQRYGKLSKSLPR